VYQLLDNHEWLLIIASQDWHPKDHVSFASAHPSTESGDSIEIPFLDTTTKTETQSLYADHCIPETWGAEIEDGIKTRLQYLEGYRTTVNYIKKAQNHSVDSYSAFADNSIISSQR
jgi:nicotinamidase/pyrazinamidase